MAFVRFTQAQPDLVDRYVLRVQGRRYDCAFDRLLDLCVAAVTRDPPPGDVATLIAIGDDGTESRSTPFSLRRQLETPR